MAPPPATLVAATRWRCALSVSVRWLLVWALPLWGCAGSVGTNLGYASGIPSYVLSLSVVGVAQLAGFGRLVTSLYTGTFAMDATPPLPDNRKLLNKLPSCVSGIVFQIAEWRIIKFKFPAHWRHILEFVCPVGPYLAFFLIFESCQLFTLVSLPLGLVFAFEDNPMATMYVSNKITSAMGRTYVLYVVSHYALPLPEGKDGETSPATYLLVLMEVIVALRWLYVGVWLHFFSGKSFLNPKWTLEPKDRDCSFTQLLLCFVYTGAIALEITVMGWVLDTCKATAMYDGFFWFIFANLVKNLTKDLGAIIFMLVDTMLTMSKVAAAALAFVWVAFTLTLLTVILFGVEEIFSDEEGAAERCISAAEITETPELFIAVFLGYSVLDVIFKLWHALEGISHYAALDRVKSDNDDLEKARSAPPLTIPTKPGDSFSSTPSGGDVNSSSDAGSQGSLLSQVPELREAPSTSSQGRQSSTSLPRGTSAPALDIPHFRPWRRLVTQRSGVEHAGPPRSNSSRNGQREPAPTWALHRAGSDPGMGEHSRSLNLT